MDPNDVKELLQSSVTELSLPVTVSDCGPLLISEDNSNATRDRLKEIVQQWMDLERDECDEIPKVAQEAREAIGFYGKHRSYRTSVGITESDMCQEIEHLALGTKRLSEVREILESLMAERKLQCNIYYIGFVVIVLPEDSTSYRDAEMLRLETLIKEQNLEVQVRHSGFNLPRNANESTDIQFSGIQDLANRVQSPLEKHGLKPYLLHNGFELKKDQEYEIDLAEIKELALRLKFMSGIDYRASGNSMGDVKKVKPEWKSDINWNYVKLFTSSPYY